MRNRCLNSNHADYPNYGGRGVKICDTWGSYEQFLADMGERPPGMTLDRIDTESGYTPANCRWATAKEQNRNRRRTIFLEGRGQRKSLGAWADELGVRHITLYKRYRAGWSDEAIVGTPKQAPTCPKPRAHRRHRLNSDS